MGSRSPAVDTNLKHHEAVAEVRVLSSAIRPQVGVTAMFRLAIQTTPRRRHEPPGEGWKRFRGTSGIDCAQSPTGKAQERGPTPRCSISITMSGRVATGKGPPKLPGHLGDKPAFSLFFSWIRTAQSPLSGSFSPQPLPGAGLPSSPPPAALTHPAAYRP